MLKVLDLWFHRSICYLLGRWIYWNAEAVWAHAPIGLPLVNCVGTQTDEAIYHSGELLQAECWSFRRSYGKASPEWKNRPRLTPLRFWSLPWKSINMKKYADEQRVMVGNSKCNIEKQMQQQCTRPSIHPLALSIHDFRIAQSINLGCCIRKVTISYCLGTQKSESTTTWSWLITAEAGDQVQDMTGVCAWPKMTMKALVFSLLQSTREVDCTLHSTSFVQCI